MTSAFPAPDTSCTDAPQFSLWELVCSIPVSSFSPLSPPNSDIIFEQIEDVQYFNKIIGEELTNDIIVLHLKSDVLYDLEYAVNNHESILEENVLLKFLNR